MSDPERTDATVKDLVRQHWDGRAETFDDEPHHGIQTAEQRDRWLAVLGEWTPDDPARVLDVGCGTGVIALLLAALDHDVTGVDAASGMLHQARAKARHAGAPIEFVRGDAESLGVATDAVDLVTARHLIWTLPNPETALADWRRVTAPGGSLILIEGYWDHDEPWDEYETIHEDLPLYDGRPPEQLRARLRRAGLQAVTYEPLADPVLWGRDPQFEYYIMRAEVPP